jgi:Peptidase propeptide and YPEB domain
MSIVLNLVLAAALGAPSPLALPSRLQGVRIEEEKPGLLKRAKISGDSAVRIALRAVPGGHVQKGEIEEEDGKLIFSLIIKVAGKAGVEEVNVDAITGKVVGQEHESDAKEAREAAAERKEAPRPKKP